MPDDRGLLPGSTDWRLQPRRAWDLVRRNVLALPLMQVRGGIDRAVVAELDECGLVRMHLEVEVRRRREGVARPAEEADHLARAHMRVREYPARIAGEVGVVERVAPLVGQPQPPAAELVPAHEAQRSSCDRDERRTERREQVVAVMPAVVDV